jgi:hypothetical protein
LSRDPLPKPDCHGPKRTLEVADPNIFGGQSGCKSLHLGTGSGINRREGNDWRLQSQNFLSSKSRVFRNPKSVELCASEPGIYGIGPAGSAGDSISRFLCASSFGGFSGECVATELP